MVTGNIKMALGSIRNAKWRSLLTMLGVIIGVVSVITTVSLGEGVKKQVEQQISQRGSNLVTILPGKRVQRNSNGEITSINPLATDGSVLTTADLETVSKVKGAGLVAPFSRISGIAESEGREYSGQIIGTSGDVPALLNQKVEFGSFFKEQDQAKDVAVIGKTVAEQLFRENVPIGNNFTIRGQTFTVRGVFEEFENALPILATADYNNAIFIPYERTKELSNGSEQIYQILVKPSEDTSVKQLLVDINNALRASHAGQEDFTVLQQKETLAVANDLLNLLTALIAGIAAISLLVGGIGIMNIMLVSVTERTSEIGIRKAIGATNRQILRQFLTEAIVLSIVGGFLGIVTSVIFNFLLRMFTDLQPVITLPVVAVAFGVALIIGVIFGVMPAMKAARKDPIESLRYE